MSTRWQKVVVAPEAFPLVMLAIAFVLLPILSPYFFTAANLSQVLTDSLEIALIALVMTPLVIIREIDISVGSIVGLTAVVFAKSTEAGIPWPFAVGIAIGTGAGAGLLNGLIVTRFKLASIVVTLGTLALYRGLANVIVADQTIVGLPEGFVGWDVLYVPGTLITVPQISVLLVALLAALALAFTSGGRKIYFMGSSPGVADATVLRTDRMKVVLFTLSGTAAAIAGLMLTSKVQSVRADTGQGLELLVLTAVLLGGVSIDGGRGSIAGAMIAVFLIGSLRSGLALAGYPSQARIAFIGLLLLASIGVNVLLRRLQDWLRLRRAARALGDTKIQSDSISSRAQ